MCKHFNGYTLENRGSNVNVSMWLFIMLFPYSKTFVFLVFYIINPRPLCLVVKLLSNLTPPYPLNNIFEFPMCTL